MSLDPDAEKLLEMMRAAGRAPMETLSPNEARQQFAAGRAVTQPDPQDVAEVTAHAVDLTQHPLVRTRQRRRGVERRPTR